MLHPLILTVRNIRQHLASMVLEQQIPPSEIAKKITELIPQISRTDLDDQQIARLWGELQIILIEAEGPATDGNNWGQIRNAIDAAFVGFLKRKEWAGLEDIFRREIFSRLASAVTAPRARRMQACIEVTALLRSLADRSIGQHQRWLLLHIAEMQYPRFGTSGWRARMGVDFTWHRATAVAQAIIEYVIESGLANKPLTIGYDSRINANKVAELVTEVAVANGISVHLASRETPSPALIYYITEEIGVASNAGLINCTPSHNPVKDVNQRAYLGTEYHGIRYNMPYGGVAPSRATDTIGRRAMELLLEDHIVPENEKQGKVIFFDPLSVYANAALDDLSTEVKLQDGAIGNSLAQMRRFWGASNAMVVIDEMHSASRGYLRAVCDKLDIKYTVVHGEKDPLLGELMYANPELPHINRCRETVKQLNAQYPRILGIGMDTDSDRFGVVDEHGNYIMMNQMLPMLADYLLTTAYNGNPGRLIRNMVTTRLLDRVALENQDKIIPPTDISTIVPHAAATNYQVMLGDPQIQSGFLTFVTPVGFKYIADVMMSDLEHVMSEPAQDAKRIQQSFHDCLQKLLLAGEESNGMTSRGHTPDKDGLWGALLTLQMCAVSGKTLGELWDSFTAKYGLLVSVRRDIQAPDIVKEAIVNEYLDRYAALAQEGITYPDEQLAGFTPSYCGGVRDELVEVILENADASPCYLTIRASGTEPINRIYIEAPSIEQREALLSAVGQQLERLILQAVAQAHDIEIIIELLAGVELPSEDDLKVPATYTKQVIGPAVARIQELYPSNAEEMILYADRELGERNPQKANSLTNAIK